MFASIKKIKKYALLIPFFFCEMIYLVSRYLIKICILVSLLKICNLFFLVRDSGMNTFTCTTFALKRYLVTYFLLIFRLRFYVRDAVVFFCADYAGAISNLPPQERDLNTHGLTICFSHGKDCPFYIHVLSRTYKLNLCARQLASHEF